MEKVLAGTEVPRLHDGLVASVLKGLGDPLRPGHISTGIGDEKVSLPGHASASLRLPWLIGLSYHARPRADQPIAHHPVASTTTG